MKTPSNNVKLNQWVQECANLCQPDSVYWCDGSTAEYNRLMGQMLASGMAIPLKSGPTAFYSAPDPSDVRVEDRTYISTPAGLRPGPPTTGSIRRSSRRP
jgi:phosphoenolpyruvate carboxykinase (GTP)